MVDYLRFPPPVAQRAYVEHLWMVRGSDSGREILIPNGRPTLVVSLGEPGTRHDPLTGREDPNGNVLFGITTRPYVLAQNGPAAYVGVQLRPWGVAALLPADRLVDEFRPLADVFGAQVLDELKQELAGHGFGAARARCLASFLASRLRPIRPDVLTQLETAVEAIEEARGLLMVEDVASRLRTSSSSVYRLFAGHLGVGPKTFCEVVRYYHFVGDLLGSDRRAGSAALLASLHGYYDQAHAARDFKRFTGVTASSFRRLHRGIADLMHS